MQGIWRTSLGKCTHQKLVPSISLQDSHARHVSNCGNTFTTPLVCHHPVMAEWLLATAAAQTYGVVHHLTTLSRDVMDGNRVDDASFLYSSTLSPFYWGRKSKMGKKEKRNCPQQHGSAKCIDSKEDISSTAVPHWRCQGKNEERAYSMCYNFSPSALHGLFSIFKAPILFIQNPVLTNLFLKKLSTIVPSCSSECNGPAPCFVFWVKIDWIFWCPLHEFQQWLPGRLSEISSGMSIF